MTCHEGGARLSDERESDGCHCCVGRHRLHPCRCFLPTHHTPPYPPHPSLRLPPSLPRQPGPGFPSPPLRLARSLPRSLVVTHFVPFRPLCVRAQCPSQAARQRASVRQADSSPSHAQLRNFPSTKDWDPPASPSPPACPRIPTFFTFLVGSRRAFWRLAFSLWTGSDGEERGGRSRSIPVRWRWSLLTRGA